MEEERDREEFKHVCKLCFKRYPSGKSLGGHMRSHVIADARKNKLLAALNKKVDNFAAENDEEDEDEDEDEDDIETDIVDRNGNGGGHSGYGLRENPKKTWRMVDSYPGKLLLQQNNNNSSNNNNNFGNGNGNGQERICKQCGKGFHSLKALCGHMSIHSDKDRNFKEEDDNSWSSDSKDQLFLAMESHSDNNNSMKRQTRSSLTRYRSLNSTNTSAAAAVAAAVDSVANNGGGSSSNHSEIDQLEQEEVAICLMMLSRDSSGSKTCFNFAAAAAAAAAESSDNNSVILEGGISCRNNNNVVAAAGGGKGKGKGKKNVDQEMDNSDSGYFENGAKELESDDSVDGFGKNYGFNKGNKFDVGSRLVDCFGDDNDHDYSRKRKIRDVGSFGFDSPDSDENNYPAGKKIKHDYFYSSNNNNNFNSHQKDGSSSKYGCGQCTKSFKTHQALGGHVISHSRKNGENDSNNTSAKAKNLGGSTTTKKGSVSKKVKGHKCPYCPKVFKSGQALGGHKRSHMIGSNSVLLHSEGRLNHIPAAAPPPVPEHKQPLIDLNLPAPDEEEASGNSQFVAL